MDKATCAAPGCERPRYRKQDYCEACYKRLRRNGTLERKIAAAAHRHGDSCSVDGCEKAARTTGLCPMHYQRKIRAGSTGDAERKRADNRGKKCSVEGCDRAADSKGYCHPHYQRVRKDGTPGAAAILDRTPRACSVESCNRQHKANGYCEAHNLRFKKHGDPRADVPLQEKVSRDGVCDIEGCDSPVFARRLCNVHYQRHLDGRDMTAPVKRHAPAGTGYVNSQGYRVIRVNGKSMLEHRKIVEDMLGRSLLPDERIHHLNTVRSDNRTDGPFRLHPGTGYMRSGNLEIRVVGKHPMGGSVGDFLEYADMLRERYGDMLA